MALSRDIPEDLARRRQKIRTYIDEHFGSQQAFCNATGLKPARVSKALHDRYISNRRLLPLEHAINQLGGDQEGAVSADAHSIPVYRLQEHALSPTGEEETIGMRAVGPNVDDERLAYVEATFGHHAVIELVDPAGVAREQLAETFREKTVEYAALVSSQWTYVTVQFDAEGRPHLSSDLDEATVRLFGRAVFTLHLRP